MPQKTGQLKQDLTIRILLAGLITTSVVAYGDIPGGIAGGENDANQAYAALITAANDVVPVSGFGAGIDGINSVDINFSGLGLIGGNHVSSNFPYAALVAADGTLTPLSLPSSDRPIRSVAINSSGLGLIGGSSDGGSNHYAAHVSADGVVSPLTFSAFAVNAVDINDLGIGLIGGEGSSLKPYAAFVTEGGTVQPILDLSMTDGHINDAAINNSGLGIVGGITDVPYAALVLADDSSVLLSPLPDGGAILEVAINDSGNGLIGGGGW